MRKFIAWVRRLIFKRWYKKQLKQEALFHGGYIQAYVELPKEKHIIKHHKNNYDVEIIKETSGRKHYWVSSQYGIHRINKNSLGD